MSKFGDKFGDDGGGSGGGRGPRGPAGPAGGSGTFTGLSDTPAKYLAPHKLVRVNAADDGVEFTNSVNAGSF